MAFFFGIIEHIIYLQSIKNKINQTRASDFFVFARMTI